MAEVQRLYWCPKKKSHSLQERAVHVWFICCFLRFYLEPCTGIMFIYFKEKFRIELPIQKKNLLKKNPVVSITVCQPWWHPWYWQEAVLIHITSHPHYTTKLLYLHSLLLLCSSLQLQ